MTEEKKKRSRIVDFVAIGLVSVILIGAYNMYKIAPEQENDIAIENTVQVEAENFKYGFSENDYHIEEHTLFPDQFLSDILIKYDVSYDKIFELEKKAKEVFNVRNIRAGKKYAIVQKDSCSVAECFIYEPDPFKYVVYNLKDSVQVNIIEREVTSSIETTSGIVQSSLWESMKDQGLSAVLIDKMEDALAWSIDFYHIQDGDRYKLIFERRYIEDKPVGIGRLLGAYYKNSDNEYYAIYYENEEYAGFYDLEGRPTKKGFLKAPVKASRISSFFSKNRLHPVLKRRKAHLGTDYAAPYGTPIMAVANGVVITAGYTKGNGKYVKVKHDKTYTTQYLHMQRFAPGIKAGVHVKQGQTIGHVGSTGLATGPHVCFRFWKNGRQVNHLRENFPPPKPMPQEQLSAFFDVRDEIIEELDAIYFNEPGHNATEQLSEAENIKTIFDIKS